MTGHEQLECRIPNRLLRIIQERDEFHPVPVGTEYPDRSHDFLPYLNIRIAHQLFNGIDKSGVVPFEKDREKVLNIAGAAV